MDVEEIRRQQFAIRSFTQSIEVEDLDERDDWKRIQRFHENVDVNELEECRGSGMKESSTDETIIEVTRRVDPTKGETQKYTMRVSGPELVDQEIELHKSLVKSASGEHLADEEEELNDAAVPSSSHEYSPPQTTFTGTDFGVDASSLETQHIGKEKREKMRRPRSSTGQFAPRPRPSTPTGLSFSRLESAEAFEAVVAEIQQQIDHRSEQQVSTSPVPLPHEKMRVVLPSKSKLKAGARRYSTGAKDLDGTTSIMRLRCDSSANTSHHFGTEDIIESNPEYAIKAPKKPVVHRRQSRGEDWENFMEEEDMTSTEASTFVVGREEREESTEKLELTKQLQQEVHRLIDEVEQQRAQLEGEEDANKEEDNHLPKEPLRNYFQNDDSLGTEFMNQKHPEELPPEPSKISNIQVKVFSESREEQAFETPAQFTSEHFATAQEGGGDAGTAPVRKAPPPPRPSQDIIESAVETRIVSTTMELPEMDSTSFSSSAVEAAPVANPFDDRDHFSPQTDYGYDLAAYGQVAVGISHGIDGAKAMQGYQQQQQFMAGPSVQEAAPPQLSYYGEGCYASYYEQQQQYGAEYSSGQQSSYADVQQQEQRYQYQDYPYSSYYEASVDFRVGEPEPAGYSNKYDSSVNEPATATNEQYTATEEENMPGATSSITQDAYEIGGGDRFATNPFESVLSDQQITQSVSNAAEDYQVDFSLYGSPPRAPPIPPPPSIGFGLSSFAQRAVTPDPFSWEAQESAIAAHGAPIPPARPPPIEPRTPERINEEQLLERRESSAESGATPSSQPKAPPPIRPPAPSPIKARPLPPPVPPSPSRGQRKSVEGIEKNEGVEKKQERDDEDAWTRFNRMTEQVSKVVKSTGERLGQLGQQTAADQLQDDQQAANIGGGDIIMQLNAAQRQQLQEQEAHRKRVKAEKKLEKLERNLGSTIGGVLAAGISAGKSVTAKGKMKKAEAKEQNYDPRKEEDLEKAATELAKKIAAQHGFQLNDGKDEVNKGEEEKEQCESEIQRISNGQLISSQSNIEKDSDKEEEAARTEMTETEASKNNWAATFEHAALLPPSESDVHLAEVLASAITDPFDTSRAKMTELGASDVPIEIDPFAPLTQREQESAGSIADDPFDVRPIEELIAEARQKAEMERNRREATSGEYDGEMSKHSRLSTPTQEGGSPVTPSMARLPGFEDDFRGENGGAETPLFDEDDSQPLPEFPPRFEGEGWELLLRYPLKKKLMADRCWKPIFVRLKDNMLSMYGNAQESRPSQEILLQANYSLSDPTLQAYDIYGKIHTVKLQYILYKERVGIRPGQISRLVEGHITKYGLPLEHAAQLTVLAKFGFLDAASIMSFNRAVEDALFHCVAKREVAPATEPLYRQDEIQIHCYDEYEARIDHEGFVHEQKARVRIFCLAFLSGTSPILEIGLNDRRREGKEIVRRKDILPMYTERWIRFDAPEFHNAVEKSAWEDDQIVRLQPPGGYFFELMRFRVRPPRNREKPLNIKCVMRIAGSTVEIRIEAAAALHQQRAKGTMESTRTIPCEDIAIRFPIPEAWIYIFREERHWGVGSVHAKTRKPGRVKNLKDRLMGTVQQSEPCLIEVGIGEAKYEHLFRSLVWRIPRLPDKQSAAYKCYLLKCRFTLSSFDLMPETFIPQSELEFTMPLAVVSNTVVRSVGVEQHEDSDRVEKFVRYVAKFHYIIDINFVHCMDLDKEEQKQQQLSSELPEQQQHGEEEDDQKAKVQYSGFRIELPDDHEQRENHSQKQTSPMGVKNVREDSEQLRGDFPGTYDIPGGRTRSSSSSSEDSEIKSFPVIQIDMKGYGY